VRRGEGWGVVALSTPRTEEAVALVENCLIGTSWTGTRPGPQVGRSIEALARTHNSQ